MKTAMLLASTLMGLFVAADVHAQAAAATAEQLFRDANALLAKGQIHEACAKFAESEKLDPQLGTLLNLATCHEKDGKVATAWGEYSELVDQAEKQKDKKRLGYAKKKLAELDSHLPHFELRVPAGTAELRLDGVVLGQGAWSSSLPVDPGDHELTYTAPGKKPGSLHATAVEGSAAVLVLPPLVGEPVAAPPALVVAPLPVVIEPPPPDTHEGSRWRTAGFVVGGVGVVGLGIGATLGALALGSKSTVMQDCHGSQCSSAGLSAVSSAKSQATGSTIGLVAGGVCAAAGLTLVLVGSKGGGTLGLAPATLTHGGGLATYGTF
jgi:hypothetical protein